ncbi:MAG: ceramide glucosyltransferase [Polyangiales bacterium]
MKTSFAALDWALWLLFASALGSGFVLHWAVLRKRRMLAVPAKHGPGVSVLKPLCGVDEGLYENLVSFVSQQYPAFELVLGIADPRDPVLDIVKRLKQAYPKAPLQVVVHGEDDPGANPKVISLLHMARVARYEHWLISDSNVRARPDYLATIAAEMADPQVGLVSSLIVGTGGSSLGAQCENLHLNTFVLGGVCIADLADQPCVVGKSMLMRRDQLAALGGFESLRRVLAEDYLLGQRYHAAGYRVVLSTHAVATHNQRLSVRRFLARHLRWAQLRRSCAIGPFLAEPLFYSSPFIAAPLLVSDTPHGFGYWGYACALGLFARVSGDALLARRASGEWPKLSVLAFLPAKDALLLAAWSIALVRRSVTWRGHSLRIATGSRLCAPSERAPSFRERLTTVWQ